MQSSQTKGRGKYLLKNIGLLTLSNFGSKILVFLLIPLYTSYLSTAEYGTYDLYTTTIQLVTPILTLNIADAVMRFSLDSKYDKSAVFTEGLKRCIIATAIFSIIVSVNRIFGIINVFCDYSVEFILLFLFGLIYNLFSQFSRGVERIKDLAVSGIINTASLLVLNILFLVNFSLGLRGYFFAYISAYFLAAAYLTFRLKIWKYISKNVSDETNKEMYTYSRPLIVNNLAWWINNVSDRYIVTWLCGVGANGIYSVAYKIPSLLNTFQTIFSQAWTISAVKEYDKDKGEFYSQIYAIYNCGMTIVCSGLILFNKVIARIMFAKEFYTAWEYAPFLTISILFGSLSGLLGGVFSAAKESKSFARTTILGASINTVCNLALVHYFGPIGAAISTLISYVIVWAARLIEANKIVQMRVNILRDVISYVLLVLQAVVWCLKLSITVSAVLQAILFAAVALMYYKDIIRLIKRFIKKSDTIEKNKR